MIRGSHHSKETKRKLSLTRQTMYKGKDNPMYGKHHTEETRLKISKNHMNCKGKNNPNYGNHKLAGKNNPNYGLHPSKEVIEKNRLAHLGKKASKETKKKMSEIHKKRWKKNRIKILNTLMKHWNIAPNKPEKELTKLLERACLNEYHYVGNGKTSIGGFNPDFIDQKNKKIIELYGDYWHTRSEIVERDLRRLKTYRLLGYKTLIIWEHELKNLQKVTEKILKFNGEK